MKISGRGRRERAFAVASRRVGVVLVSFTLLVLTGLMQPATAVASSAASASSAAASAASRSLGIVLTGVSPAAVVPTSPLTISGTVHNPGRSAIKNVKVALRLHPGLLVGRTGIDDWLSEGVLSTVDATLPGTAKIKSVGAGATVAFMISVPAGRTGLGTLNLFGPRGFGLQATTGATELGVLRSSFVWMPTEQTAHTKLSLLVPITSTTPSTDAGRPTEEVAATLAPGGRLERILAASQDKAVAWAIDPAVLAAAQEMVATGVRTDDSDSSDDSDDSDDPDASSTPSTTSAPGKDSGAMAAARAWLNQLRTERQGRGLIALPYADPDLTATLRSRASMPLLRNSDSLGRQVALETLGMNIDTTVAWPADGKLNPVGAGRLEQTGRTAVVLAAGTQPPDPVLSYTPTGRSTVRAGDRETLTGLLYDEQLSSLFRSSGAQQGAAATQTMLSQLAAITRENPQARHLLAVAPRNWDPNPAGVRNLMSAMRSAPWISLRGINELRGTEATTPRILTPKYGNKAKAAELPIGNISAVLAMQRDVATFAPALDPKIEPGVIDPLRERIASLLSVAWRGDRGDLGSSRTEVRTDVEDLVDGVHLRGGGSVLFTAKSANIQLNIDNRTPYAITVKVQVKPSSGQIAFDDGFTVTAPADTRLFPVLIPTRAVAKGNVRVEAKLLTTKGGQLGSSLNFTVKVRPGWETVAMIIAGSVLGLLLVIGLLRSIRRGGHRVPPDSVPDVDDTATARATGSIPVIPTDPAEPVEETDSGTDTASRLGSTGGASAPQKARSPAMPRETR